MGAVQAMVPGDPERTGLILDRALQPGDVDLFAHDDYVDELERLVNDGVVSANVALYGSWGAGKSGIAKRLRGRLKQRRQADSIVFVEFNASKYARNPLMRQFILQIARETGGPERTEKYRQKLYARITHQELSAPTQWSSGLRTALRTLLALLVVDIGLLATLSGAAQHTIASVSRFLLPTLVSGGAVASLAMRLLPLMTATLQVEAPTTEEQFEEIFAELLSELKITGGDGRRLVVLIDELDRCSPQQVADTLESLRTFLDVPGCIFIVAADQQALEHALTLRVRQATPADPTNPYYSAGSAYLDKIFEYQLALPPLLPARLVDFAGEVVRGADGVWAELADPERVLSVLIPVHVHSPRRVKVLLNRFALAYAIAKKRAGHGRLEEDLAERAEELAKLVCLRTEFPLFVADLEADWRMPDLVLRWRDHLASGASHEDPALRAVDPVLSQRARLYAEGRLPVAELLADERPDLGSVATGSGATPTSGIDSDGEGEFEVPGEHGRVTAVHRTHGYQLVDYLQKTRRVPGPRRDLIHLEAAGAVEGMDPSVARQIELQAISNQPEALVASITRLEAEEQLRALTMLASQLRAAKGNDADNVAHCLLRAVGCIPGELGQVTHLLAPELGEYAGRGALAEEDLPGALRLGVLGKHAPLVELVMRREEVLSNTALGEMVIELAPELASRYEERLASFVVNAALMGEGDELGSRLAALRAPEGAGLLRSADAAIREALSVAATAAQVPAAAPRQVGVPVARPTADPEATEALDSIVASYRRWVRSLSARGARTLAELALVPLIQAAQSHVPLYELQTELQEELGRATTPELSKVLLEDVSSWKVDSWAERLGFVDPSLIEPEDRTVAAWALAKALWCTPPGSLTDEGEGAVLDRLATITKGVVATAGNEPTVAVTEEIGAPFSPVDVAERAELIVRAVRFRDAGLVEASALADAVLGVASQAANGSPDAGVDISLLSDILTSLVRDQATSATADQVDETLDAVKRSDWIEAPAQVTLVLSLSLAMPSERRHSPFSGAALADLVDKHGPAATDPIALWLSGFRPEPADVARALGGLVQLTDDDTLLRAVDGFSASLSVAARAAVVVPWVENAFARAPTAEFLSAARFSEADEDEVATCLADLATRAERADQRETVMFLWQQFAPRNDGARRVLIRSVLIPFSAVGAGAYELVRRNLKLAVPPPHGTKQEVATKLQENAPDEQRARAMRDRMTELGLLERKPRRFGPFKF